MSQRYQLPVYVIPETRQKFTSVFTELGNNLGVKRETVCQIVMFISLFSLNLEANF